MGIAAYNRGSQAISNQITHEYEEVRGNRRRRLREQMKRAEIKIQDLEQFCRDAQTLYVDSTFPGSASTLLEHNIEHFWQKKKDTKKFKAMYEECCLAHTAWLDSDHRQSFNHLHACIRKARAWKTLLTYLNSFYKWPFEIPRYL